MRFAAPYAVDGGEPITRHRLLPGQHRGAHRGRFRLPRRRLSLGGVLTMALAAVTVPVSWWILLAGVGINQETVPGPHAPAIAPSRVVLPPISVGPRYTASPSAATRPTPAPRPRPSAATKTQTRQATMPASASCPPTGSRRP